MTNEVEDKPESYKDATGAHPVSLGEKKEAKPEPTVIDNEIRELRRQVKRLGKIPRALHALISYTYQYDGIRIIPSGSTEEHQTEGARKMRGHLERAGIKLEVEKEKSSNGSETMYLVWNNGDDKFSIANYMPRTCKRVVKMVDVPAEEEQITPAVAAHKVERITIECDGLPSQLVSEKKIPVPNDTTKERVEKDLDQAELET